MHHKAIEGSALESQFYAFNLTFMTSQRGRVYSTDIRVGD